jgi:hypothetical protein
MNQRNWDALCALLSDYVMSEGHGTDLDNIHLSKWLADRGVLVPSTLSMDDVQVIYDNLNQARYDEEDCQPTRDALERIAKGVASPADA